MMGLGNQGKGVRTGQAGGDPGGEIGWGHHAELAADEVNGQLHALQQLGFRLFGPGQAMENAAVELPLPASVRPAQGMRSEERRVGNEGRPRVVAWCVNKKTKIAD